VWWRGEDPPILVVVRGRMGGKNRGEYISR